MKYDLPENQGEVLPNKLGLTSLSEIEIAEFEGFLKAEIVFTENLSPSTRFNIDYILSIHKLALSHLYSFAGELRSVNLSKGGFAFPSARFLDKSMKELEESILNKLPATYKDQNELIRDIAKVHAELLFIHPFREGNGRTARVLANLMARKAGFGRLRFEKITKENFNQYVLAIQKAAFQDYSEMERIISSVFPG